MLVLMGCGYTLERLASSEAQRGRQLVASTRDAARTERLLAAGSNVRVVPDHLEAVRAHAAGAQVVYSLPPDAGLDEALAAELARHRPSRFVYLSSTGVYGRARGVVTEETPVDDSPEAAGTPGAARLKAERLFAPLGAISLRVSGIYGPGRGLHERLRAGGYAMPGDGSGRISRVHVDDLAEAIRSVLEVEDALLPADRVLNVADDDAAPQRDVVEWLCARMGLPLPRSIPLEAAPVTLRGDRAVANSRLKTLGWTPRFATYREGFSALLEPSKKGGL